jgi:3-hydroxyacyl-CoA dehydrogenase, C-terminal domain
MIDWPLTLTTNPDGSIDGLLTLLNIGDDEDGEKEFILTSPDTTTITLNLMKQVGQRPMRVKKEIVGFALNRILGAFMNEFFALIRDGVVEPEDVDDALTEGFGLR